MEIVRRLHIGGRYKSDGWEVLNANPAPYVDHVCNAVNIKKVAEFGLFEDTSSMKFKGVPISLNMIAEKRSGTV